MSVSCRREGLRALLGIFRSKHPKQKHAAGLLQGLTSSHTHVSIRMWNLGGWFGLLMLPSLDQIHRCSCGNDIFTRRGGGALLPPPSLLYGQVCGHTIDFKDAFANDVSDPIPHRVQGIAQHRFH